MAGSTFQPPIHLDPNQDPGQQTAFINQNFQSLAAALETNSFRIVSEGTLTIPSYSPTFFVFKTYTNQSFSTTVTHNLGFVPAVLAYVTDNAGTLYELMPYVNVNAGGGNSVSGGGLSIVNADVVVTSTSIYATSSMTCYGDYNFSGIVQSATTIKYYLLQQTGN